MEICGARWRVELCRSWGDSSEGGCCDPAQHTIKINASMCDEMIVEVFFHELIHAMLAASGATYGIDCEIEERIVYPLAPVMLDVFRKNRFRFC